MADLKSEGRWVVVWYVKKPSTVKYQFECLDCALQDEEDTDPAWKPVHFTTIYPAGSACYLCGKPVMEW